MKKFKISTVTAIAVYAMLAAGILSCGERENVKEHTRGFEPTINYYHDCRTGLCFAEIVQGNVITGHTCVPCDSVRRFFTALPLTVGYIRSALITNFKI